MDTHNTPLLAWQATSKLTHNRSSRWYTAGGVLCATFIAYGLLSGAWTLSLIFGTIAGLYFLIRSEPGQEHTIALYPMGIEFDGSFKSWADFREFWILQAESYSELHISSIRGWRPDIVIQTSTIDPYELRDLMAQYLPQIGHQKEKLLDAIIRFCKL